MKKAAEYRQRWRIEDWSDRISIAYYAAVEATVATSLNAMVWSVFLWVRVDTRTWK